MQIFKRKTFQETLDALEIELKALINKRLEGHWELKGRDVDVTFELSVKVYEEDGKDIL